MLKRRVTVGVLALQGAFSEHVQLLRLAASEINSAGKDDWDWHFEEIRTPEELACCDALVIPGGESTTMSLVAARSGLLEPLRSFVKVWRKPTWGTCAGLILLAESANRTKRGGQELIGGIDVRVNRNHFGRQNESFQADLDLGFLYPNGSRPSSTPPFRSVFIRAPVVERILPHEKGIQVDEARKEDTVVAPSRTPETAAALNVMESEVEILARLSKKESTGATNQLYPTADRDDDIIAVRQGNVFGTSFHPELTGDPRIHRWWLQQVVAALDQRNVDEGKPIKSSHQTSIEHR